MKEKKSKQVRRKYYADFKQQVLQMITTGRPVREVAESLGIGENLIYRWRSHKEVVGKENVSATTDQQALLGRIKELELERDILDQQTCVSIGS
jgi:transposase